MDGKLVQENVTDVDDIMLSALVADHERQAAGGHDMLLGNWDGKAPIISLIQHVLAQEANPTGEQLAGLIDHAGFVCQKSINPKG